MAKEEKPGSQLMAANNQKPEATEKLSDAELFRLAAGVGGKNTGYAHEKPSRRTIWRSRERY